MNPRALPELPPIYPDMELTEAEWAPEVSSTEFKRITNPKQRPNTGVYTKGESK